MKIEIHLYHHYDNESQRENPFGMSCDLGINNGTGDISYHDWNVKYNKKCGQCKGTKLHKKVIKY